MSAPATKQVLPYGAALLAAAATPLFGWSALLLAALLLAVGVAGGGARGASRRIWAASGAGVAGLGGVVGVASAADTLVRVALVEPYAGRAALGWAGLVLAAAAGTAGVVPVRRPARAALAVVTGLLGTAAMGAFYLNSYYVLAVPLWLLGATLGLAARTPTGAPPARNGS